MSDLLQIDFSQLPGQHVVGIDLGTTNSLIAVSPVNPQIVWAAGRNGTFTKTTDGGQTWQAGVVPGAETLQFRDVEAVSEKVAYLLSLPTATVELLTTLSAFGPLVCNPACKPFSLKNV